MKKQLCLLIALAMLAGFIPLSPGAAAQSRGDLARLDRGALLLGEAAYPPGDDQPADTVLGTITADDVTLWAEAYEGSQALAQFGAGQVVYIFYRSGDFYYVQIPVAGLVGYLLTTLL